MGPQYSFLQERRAGTVEFLRHQDHRQCDRKSLPTGRDPRVDALHAPEVECIGKGKTRRRHEFGCKWSTATPVTRLKGGQFVFHAKALHGDAFDLVAVGCDVRFLVRWFERILRPP